MSNGCPPGGGHDFKEKYHITAMRPIWKFFDGLTTIKVTLIFQGALPEFPINSLGLPEPIHFAAFAADDLLRSISFSVVSRFLINADPPHGGYKNYSKKEL